MSPEISRRTFLRSAAAAAGAAFLQACRGKPEPPPYPMSPVDPTTIDTRWPVKRVIYLMMENRSFDHMFGRFPGVNGTTTGSRDGREVPLVPAPQWMPGDLSHDLSAYERHVNGGKMDGFADEQVPVSQAFAYSQYEERDLPNYWHWAREFVLSDNFFASAHGNSFPQHLYMIAGTSGGTNDSPRQSNRMLRERKAQGLAKTWGCDIGDGAFVVVTHPDGTTEEVRPCFDFVTQGDQLAGEGIDWAYYAAEPHQVGYIWNAYAAVERIFHSEQWDQRIRPVDNLIRDIREGVLPPVTWVTPLYQLSDHPPWSVCHAHNWVTAIVNAVMRSPMWDHTAIFITWDEWGGFFDHVEPPKVDDFGLGIRVPLLTISPFAERGLIDTEQGEFTSVHRFIADNWGLDHLTERVRGTHNFEHVFDFRKRPGDPDPRPLKTGCRGDRLTAYRDVEHWPPPFGELET
jgi:phospholipase C